MSCGGKDGEDERREAAVERRRRRRRHHRRHCHKTAARTDCHVVRRAAAAANKKPRRRRPSVAASVETRRATGAGVAPPAQMARGRRGNADVDGRGREDNWRRPLMSTDTATYWQRRRFRPSVTSWYRTAPDLEVFGSFGRTVGFPQS